jgi:hypothetical protein
MEVSLMDPSWYGKLSKRIEILCTLKIPTLNSKGITAENENSLGDCLLIKEEGVLRVRELESKL